MRFRIPFSPGRPFDVVGLGLNAVDDLCVVPKFPEFNTKVRYLSIQRQGGGQVATAMVALARWGLKTRYMGKVGDDDKGRFSLESIRAEGVDVSHVLMEPGASSQYAFIIVDATNGERTIIWDRDERLLYREGELSREAVCSGRVLHLDGHDVAATCRAVEWAREVGIPTVIDVDKMEQGTQEMIRHIDFVIGSRTFPTTLTGIEDPVEALTTLARKVKGFVAMTLGRDGALAMTPEGPIHCPGFPVAAVDTTGAGDVFHAGFIFGLLQDWELMRILEFANAVAAMKCTEMGGRAGIPTLHQAFTFLTHRLPHWCPFGPGEADA